jgi:hypothetical protein
LGSVTIVATIAGFIVSGIDHPPRVALVILYGFSSAAVGVALWMRSRPARYGYIVWFATVFMFILTFDESYDLYLIPVYIGMLLISLLGYSFISRHTR